MWLNDYTSISGRGFKCCSVHRFGRIIFCIYFPDQQNRKHIMTLWLATIVDSFIRNVLVRNRYYM